jgi:hypothetical protein
MNKMINKLKDNNEANNIKLSDFDLETFKIDKENNTVIIEDTITKDNIIGDTIINIDDILSNEIRFYYINRICDMTNEKEICKYFIKSTIYNYYTDFVLNMELYNKIKSLHHKIYINKYIFMKYRNIKPDIIKELVKIYINSSLLIDLIKDIIVTKSKYLVEQILKNKVIIINNTDYEKLKEYAINSHSTEVYDILTIYESLDYLSNDIYFDKVKSN